MDCLCMLIYTKIEPMFLRSSRQMMIVNSAPWGFDFLTLKQLKVKKTLVRPFIV